MFGHFYKQCTEASNHYLDWSRFGELLTSATHRYSRDELMIRGGIITFTAASGLIAAYLNNEEKTYCADLTIGLAGALFGFVASHAVAIYPLISKRLEMSRDCDKLAEEIQSNLNDHHPELDQDSIHSIQAVIDAVYDLSLSNDQHGNASKTWGMRKRIFSYLLLQMNSGVFEKDFWMRDTNVIVKDLQENCSLDVLEANQRPTHAGVTSRSPTY